MTKTEKRYGPKISQLRTFFSDPKHPRIPTPLPRPFRAAARYLEREGFLSGEDAVKRPGSMTVVRGYMLATPILGGATTIPTT